MVLFDPHDILKQGFGKIDGYFKTKVSQINRPHPIDATRDSYQVLRYGAGKRPALVAALLTQHMGPEEDIVIVGERSA